MDRMTGNERTLLMFVVGYFGANGVPHFVKGITRSPHAMIFTNRPIPNLLAGSGALVVMGLLWLVAQPESDLVPAFFGCAVGVLLIGICGPGPAHSGARTPWRRIGRTFNGRALTFSPFHGW